MKLAIHGKMCSGKTTLSNFIINYLIHHKNITLKKVAFADKVYNIAYDLFNMKTKSRELLQAIGTKMREIDEDIWIKYVLNNNDDNIIVDDLRYPNELNALKQAGFILIKLELDKDEQLKRLKKCYPETYQEHINNMNHESELLMESIDDSNFDLIIKSDNHVIENLIHFIENKLFQKEEKDNFDMETVYESLYY